MNHLSVCSIILVIFFQVEAKDLPPKFPRCRQDLPVKEFSECVLRATETVKPYLRQGIPDLNIPSVAPLFLSSITLKDENNVATYRISFKNLTLYGLDDYKFTKIEADLKNDTFHGEVTIPYLYLVGKYLGTGKFLGTILEGKGDFWTNLTNCEGVVDIKTKIVTRKDVRYSEVVTLGTKIEVGKVVDYYIGGLFGDNEILAKVAEKTIKDNLDLVVEEAKPAVEKTMVKLFKDIIFKALSKIPYDKLYPLTV